MSVDHRKEAASGHHPVRPFGLYWVYIWGASIGAIQSSYEACWVYR
jgi:hypothetical protein